MFRVTGKLSASLDLHVSNPDPNAIANRITNLNLQYNHNPYVQI